MAARKRTLTECERRLGTTWAHALDDTLAPWGIERGSTLRFNERGRAVPYGTLALAVDSAHPEVQVPGILTLAVTGALVLVNAAGVIPCEGEWRVVGPLSEAFGEARVPRRRDDAPEPEPNVEAFPRA